MDKLTTYDGVFIPTTLNVLSILIYLRFGYIVGQAGVIGSFLLLIVSYAINLLTTLSLSAIATNGVVKGGGAYYMISRCLGPEFGGSIGIVFYIGQVLNAGLNVAGFADPLLNNFKQLPKQYSFLYETLLLLVCTFICLLGPQLFARSSKLLFYILLAATLAVPVSTLFVNGFYLEKYDAFYTGISLKTLKSNLMPQVKGNLNELFGLCFSATAGILAGASMSGDLQNPSKSIPKGTLSGLLLTFVLYGSVILALGCSVERKLLNSDFDVISDIDLSPKLVALGEFATSIFSALMGVIGAAKLLQAIAKDDVVPFISKFGVGFGSDDNPVYAILFTYFLTQLTILLDVNKIAVYISMALLMTFVVLNLACFLLEIASAPNFRPSFRHFSARTAFVGFVSCIVAMFATDYFASLSILLLGVVIFVVIHAYSPPKPWGDVSQSIIYHQTRKYLLKLKQNHVKYWRPQILLFVDDPRSGWQLIRFCNFLKKGGLFVLGHVVVLGDQNDFHSNAIEIARQRMAWEKLRDLHKMKAFFQIQASTSVVWGARNVFLGSGLGGMRPNISVLGFYDENELGQVRRDEVDVEELPTDHLRRESHCSLNEYVQILEDLLTLGSNVCVARGFMDIELPATTKWFNFNHNTSTSKEYIDLYPIQMSAKLLDPDGSANGLSINLDTYTLILQLGSILHSVKAWSFTHKLRVVAFVEKEQEVKRETFRITELLDTLRINAEIKVVPLNKDNFVYDVIVKGLEDTDEYVYQKLKSSVWYQKLREARQSQNFEIPEYSKQNAFVIPKVSFKKKRTLSSLQKLGVAHSMQSTSWLPEHTGSFVDDDNLPVEEAGPSFQDDPMDASQLGSPTKHSQTMPYQRQVSPQPQVKFKSQEDLKFNDLPASSQHLILNCLMKRVSTNSTVIFTTLPPPPMGTHLSDESCEKYLRLLQIFSDGLPPMAMVNAQSMTVTTSL